MKKILVAVLISLSLFFLASCNPDMERPAGTQEQEPQQTGPVTLRLESKSAIPFAWELFQSDGVQKSSGELLKGGVASIPDLESGAYLLKYKNDNKNISKAEIIVLPADKTVSVDEANPQETNDLEVWTTASVLGTNEIESITYILYGNGTGKKIDMAGLVGLDTFNQESSEDSEGDAEDSVICDLVWKAANGKLYLSTVTGEFELLALDKAGEAEMKWGSRVFKKQSGTSGEGMKGVWKPIVAVPELTKGFLSGLVGEEGGIPDGIWDTIVSASNNLLAIPQIRLVIDDEGFHLKARADLNELEPILDVQLQLAADCAVNLKNAEDLFSAKLSEDKGIMILTFNEEKGFFIPLSRVDETEEEAEGSFFEDEKSLTVLGLFQELGNIEINKSSMLGLILPSDVGPEFNAATTWGDFIKNLYLGDTDPVKWTILECSSTGSWEANYAEEVWYQINENSLWTMDGEYNHLYTSSEGGRTGLDFSSYYADLSEIRQMNFGETKDFTIPYYYNSYSSYADGDLVLKLKKEKANLSWEQCANLILGGSGSKLGVIFTTDGKVLLRFLAGPGEEMTNVFEINNNSDREHEIQIADIIFTYKIVEDDLIVNARLVYDPAYTDDPAAKVIKDASLSLHLPLNAGHTAVVPLVYNGQDLEGKF